LPMVGGSLRVLRLHPPLKLEGKQIMNNGLSRDTDNTKHKTQNKDKQTNKHTQKTNKQKTKQTKNQAKKNKNKNKKASKHNIESLKDEHHGPNLKTRG